MNSSRQPTRRRLLRPSATFASILLTTCASLWVGNAVANESDTASKPMVIKRHDLPSSSIQLHGWAKEFMKRQEDGLTGHPEQSGYPFNTGMWTGPMDVKDREFGQFGSGWWPYEQTGYYLDGALRCGYINQSTEMLEKVRKNIRYVLNHADADGTLRADKIEDDWWPMVVFMRILFEEYKNTQDPELLAAIQKHYRAVYSKEASFPQIDKLDFNARALLHVEHLCSLAEITKDPFYTDAAERLYHTAGPSLATVMAKGMAEGVDPEGHAVTYHEFLKLPAILYTLTGKEIYRKGFERAYEMLSEQHELACGLSSATEELNGKSPIQAHELCNAIDFNWSAGYALVATGDAKYADKMEKVLYNAGFGSITSDFKAHQYYSTPNVPISRNDSSFYNNDSGWGKYGRGRICYRPGHDTECCTGNVHRMFPTFLNRMCLVDGDRASVALYLPSTVELPMTKGKLTLTQKTNYPFEHTVNIEIDHAPSHEITLALRVPGWAESYNIHLNGKKILSGKESSFFAELKRVFKAGDQVAIAFEAAPVIDSIGRGKAINYGPLVFSYPVAAKQIITTESPAGKASPQFPAYQYLPVDPVGWAYALSSKLTPEDINLTKSPTKGYPWDAGQSPIQIKVPARKVTNWALGEGDQAWGLEPGAIATDFPSKLEVESAQVELTLEPSGATLLRTTVFPKGDF